MRRRRFIAALSATVCSGCSALTDQRRSSVTDSRTTTSTPTDTATAKSSTESATEPTAADPDSETTPADVSDGWPPDRRVVAQRTVDRTLALSPAGHTTADHGRVELGFAAPATPDRPALLRATLTNLNDFENTFRLDETPPFDSTPDASPDTTANRLPVFLAPTENHDLREVVPAYERGDDGRWLLTDEDDWLPETVTLGPDETVRSEYRLVQHPDSEDPPLGRYEIGPEFALGLTAWPTTGPGPDNSSAFAGATPPSLPVERPVNWYHDAGPETPVYLEPSAESVTLPAEIEFTLHNHSRRSLSCEFFHLYRLEDGVWESLRHGYAVQACYGRAPGDRTTFRLRAFPGKIVYGDGGMRSHSMQLDPGRYAFAVGYDVVYAAYFDLGESECSVRDGHESGP
ncbi:hypothetical protein [Halorussus salinisoli]|uniref:hypothetical protein n=1 Tax=Halorussus salinisoli TaxID=2558242 RepID=UPI0010C197D1|nr:hypothetical protein [Halorussus salinisoli]